MIDERKKYKAANQFCELHFWLVRNGKFVKATETHHILGSTFGGRRDHRKAHIINVCNRCHEWIHDNHKREGIVLCLYVKSRKNPSELDWEILDDGFAGDTVLGYMDDERFDEDCKRTDTNEFMFPLLVPMLESLRKTGKEVS